MNLDAVLADYEQRLTNHKGYIARFSTNQNALEKQFAQHTEQIKQLMMMQVAMHTVLKQLGQKLGVDVPAMLAEIGATYQNSAGGVRVQDVSNDAVDNERFDALRHQVDELRANIVDMARDLSEVQPAAQASDIAQFMVNRARIQIQNALGLNGQGHHMIDELNAKFIVFKKEVRRHIFWIGCEVKYFAPMVVLHTTYENIYVPAHHHEDLDEFVSSCIAGDDNEDMNEVERLEFTPPDTPILQYARGPFRRTTLAPYIHPIDGSWYLFWSANCRQYLLDRLLKESAIEGTDYMFLCWSPLELRTWMLKLARMLIRYPDDKTKPFPACIMWRDHVLANWSQEGEPALRLSLRNVFDEATD